MGRRRCGWWLVAQLGDDRPGYRGRRLRARCRAGRAGDPRARSRAAFGSLRGGDAGPVCLRAHLFRPARFVHGGSQPVRGPPPDGHAAGGRASGRDGPGHAGPGHGRAGRRGVRRAVRHPVSRRARPESVYGQDVHPAVPDDASPGGDSQAQPAARGRPGQAPDRRRRLDRARDDDQADRRAAAQGRRRRGPRPDQRAADLPPMLLRDRHPGGDRAHRGDPHRRRDSRLHRGGFVGVPVDPGRAGRAGPAV